VALFAGILVFAGLVHGTLGMGFPVVATPLLSLVVDVRTAILLTLLPTVAVNVGSILRGGAFGESIGVREADYIGRHGRDTRSRSTDAITSPVSPARGGLCREQRERACISDRSPARR